MGITLLIETKRTLGYEASDMNGCFEGELLAVHPELDGVFYGTTSNQLTTVGEVVIREEDPDDVASRLGADTFNLMLACIPYGSKVGQIVERDEDGDPRIRTPYVVHQMKDYFGACDHRWDSGKRFDGIVAELEKRVEVDRELIFGAFVTEEMVFVIERDQETDEVKKKKAKNDGSKSGAEAHARVTGAH